ncbi:MAG TPA: transcriptional regulator [Candidatus Kaiserbacteria bacterium]|nr:transcriptional regulator [Candidatus Kaiserbacteria bacterium]
MNKEQILEKFNELMSLPGETEVAEWKEANEGFDFKKLGKYFSALSNEANLKSKNSAWLILGVEDNKNVVGTKYRENRVGLDSLKSEIAQQTTTNISFIEIYEAEPEENKRVVLFEIPPAPHGIPIGFKGHYYAREGEALTSLSIEKIDRIRNQKAIKDWSIGICSDASIEDLDLRAIKKAKQGFAIKHPKISKKEIQNWSTEVFLNKAGFTIKGQITRTAIILLGKPEAEYFINPSTSEISWILKDSEGIEKDYEHFTCPLILSVTEIYKKIRNLRYRYISDGTLFPDEIDRYDPVTIREALNNAIAHQDYEMAGRINIIENEDDSLVFSNLGVFIPGSIENVIDSNSPSEHYRNKFLADAMVKVNMIDTIGSGIRKMFLSQKKRFFPLPEYDLANNKVELEIIGKVLDIKYARKLAQIPNLDLKIIMALDKVQKGKEITKKENKELRSRGLIEGKSPNLFISSVVAKKTKEQSDYMKLKGIEDSYAQKMIVDYIRKFGKAKRVDLEDMILDKLPDILDEDQKKNKVKNLLQKLKIEGIIAVSNDRKWSLSK